MRKVRFTRLAIGRFSSFVLARTAASAMQAFTMVLLARSIGPVAFGGFSASLALGLILGSLLGLGSSAQALRLLATSEPERTAATYLLLRGCTVLIVAPLLLLAGQWGPPDVVILAIIYIASELFAELCQAILLGMHCTILAHIAILVRRALPMLALLSGTYFDWQPIQSLSVGWGISGMIILVMCLPFVARPMDVRIVIRSGIHFWLSTAMAKLQNLDVMLLQAVVGSAFVGQYSAAARVTGPLNLLISTATSILTPKMATAKSRNDLTAVFKDARYALCIYMAVLAAASPATFWLGPLVLGEDYRGSAVLFAAFTIAAGVDGIGQAYIALLYAQDRSRILTIVRLVSLPIGLAFLAIATTLAGTFGAGVGIIAMPLMFLVLLHRAVTRSRILAH